MPKVTGYLDPTPEPGQQPTPDPREPKMRLGESLTPALQGLLHQRRVCGTTREPVIRMPSVGKPPSPKD